MGDGCRAAGACFYNEERNWCNPSNMAEMHAPSSSNNQGITDAHGGYMSGHGYAESAVGQLYRETPLDESCTTEELANGCVQHVYPQWNMRFCHCDNSESEVGLTKEERSAKSMEEPEKPEKPKRSRERKGEKGKGEPNGAGKPERMKPEMKGKPEKEKRVGGYAGECKETDLPKGCETVMLPMGPMKVPACQCPDDAETERAVGGACWMYDGNKDGCRAAGACFYNEERNW